MVEGKVLWKDSKGFHSVHGRYSNALSIISWVRSPYQDAESGKLGRYCLVPPLSLPFIGSVSENKKWWLERSSFWPQEMTYRLPSSWVPLNLFTWHLSSSALFPFYAKLHLSKFWRSISSLASAGVFINIWMNFSLALQGKLEEGQGALVEERPNFGSWFCHLQAVWHLGQVTQLLWASLSLRLG